nr:translation initiation factor IF-2-like [Macaca fascicularis]
MTELSATRSPSPLGVLRGGHSPAAAPAHTGREQGRGAPAPQCVPSPAALSRRHQPGRLLLHPGSGPAQHRWTLPKGCARHRCHRAVPRPAAVRTPETARQAGSRPPSADHPEPAGQRRGPGREREGLEGALDPPSQPGRRHLGLSQGRPRPPHSRVPVTRAAGPLLGKPGGPRGARGTSSARARRFPLKFHRSPRRSGSAHRGLRSARMGGRWAGWLHPAVGTNFENGPCAPLGCGADPGTAAAGGVGGERRRRAGRTRHLRSGVRGFRGAADGAHS